MADNKTETELQEIAGGWITERKGTDVPTFLKFAYIVIAGGAVCYVLFFMNGETTHSDRGPLVQQFNQATGTADGFMYMVMGLMLVFAVCVVLFAFRKPQH